MEEPRRHRRAHEVIAEVEPLDVKPPAKPDLLGEMNQHHERDELRGAEKRGTGNDEGQRHLVRLVSKALDRKGMSQHAEAGEDDEGPDERPRSAGANERDPDGDRDRTQAHDVGASGHGEAPPVHH